MTKEQQQLVEDNMKLVYWVISKEYPKYRYDEEIVQSGMLGLCLAAENWKEQSAFSTYAVKYIRGEINQEFIRRKPLSKQVSLDKNIGEDCCLGDVLVGEDDVPFFDDTFMEMLSKEEQDTLSMDSAGFSTDEIAEMSGFSVQKVQKILRLIKLKWEKFNED